MPVILLVDDERTFRESLRATLVGEGFSVRTAKDGAEALKRYAEISPDLVLLDVMMPKMNGFVTCGEIRKLNQLVPIIFLTAMGSEADQVRGLGLGADDYISKTTASSVLVARVRRALERAVAVSADDALARKLNLASVEVDLDRLTVTGEGFEERLTKTEADILRVLASDRGRSMTGDALVTALRGTGFACEDGMIYAHMSRLRHKLGPASEFLVCERGSGYRLVL